MRKLFAVALTTFAAISLATGFNASAQNTLRNGYFLDGYNYRYKLNPSFGNDLNFISIPAAGNINIGTSGNVALSTFLFPNGDGTLNTFLSSKVSSDEFLSGIKDNNLLGADLNETVFAFGFHTGEVYHTFDLSLRANVGVNVPGDMFKFIKKGSENTVIDNMGYKINSFIEASYGFSTDISERVRLGARIKGIVGAGYLNGTIEKGNIVANGDIWSVSAKGALESGGYLQYRIDPQTNAIDSPIPDVSDSVVAPSLGGALDLGVTVKATDHLSLSFAVLDLGVIMWNNVSYAETPDTQWEFEGFNTSRDDSENDDFNQMLDDLSDCFTFYKTKSDATNMRSLSPTITAGVEYILPTYENLSFGGLWTSKINGAYSWNELRASVNYATCDWFSFNVSAAPSTFGFSTGAMINLHPKGINFFLGTDNFLPWTRVSNYGIPVDSLTTNLTLGLNITFGKYIGRIPKKAKANSGE